MKIATWNLARPSALPSLKHAAITEHLKNIDAEIVVLTETNDQIDPGSEYKAFHTSYPAALPFKNTFITYGPGEVRVSIFSKYDCIEIMDSYDHSTSICTLLATPFGNIAVYGTILGILGNRTKDFTGDIEKQLADYQSISEKYPMIIAGDLNMSFSDNYYFTNEGRTRLTDALE